MLGDNRRYLRVSGKRTRKYFDVHSPVTISEITARFYRAVFVTSSSDSSEKMRIIVKSKRAVRYAYDYKLSVIPTVVTT